MAKIFAVLLIVIWFVTVCEKEQTISSLPLGQKVVAKSKNLKEVKANKKEEINDSVADTTDSMIDFRSIQGRKLADLYCDIVGVCGPVGAKHRVNYNQQLADMWKKKLDRKKVSASTIANADRPVTLYNEDPRKMSLKEFIAQADREVSIVKTKLNYSGVCKSYKLNTSECNTWKTLAKGVKGTDLVTYGLTELMPSADGDLNVKILSLLLKNAGSNYMFGIPAMYDSMLSLGFYQFTSYAIMDDGKHLAGASHINRYLPKNARIPGSVIELRNGEHHRAAYLFALHNFAILAKKTNNKEFAALRNAINKKPGDIVTYMAVSHHAPSHALPCMKKWLSKGAKGELNTYLVPSLKPYAKKSDNNLFALEKV